MSADAYDLLIVGAGLAGAGLALGLRGSGLSVCLLDAAEAPRMPAPHAPLDLQVSAITAGSVRYLASVGAWPLLPATRREAMIAMDIVDAAAGGARIGFDSAALGEPWLGFISEQRALVAALHQALDDVPEVRRFAGAGLQGLRIGSAAVTAELDDGRRLRARLVAGADGVHSRVRQAAGFDVAFRPLRQAALVTHVATAQPHGSRAFQRFVRGEPVAFLPLPDGRSSIVWSGAPGRIEALMQLDDTRFGAALTEASGGRFGAVHATERRVQRPLSALAAGYAGPRCALLGDAAHAVHPMAGLGANLGLGDAATLAELLGDLPPGHDAGDPAVLRRYARWRRSENTPVITAIDGLQRLFEARRLDRLRGLGLRLTDHGAALKAFLQGRAGGIRGHLPRRMQVADY